MLKLPALKTVLDEHRPAFVRRRDRHPGAFLFPAGVGGRDTAYAILDLAAFSMHKLEWGTREIYDGGTA